MSKVVTCVNSVGTTLEQGKDYPVIKETRRRIKVTKGLFRNEGYYLKSRFVEKKEPIEGQIKVGDKVRIKASSQFYSDSDINNPSCNGVVAQSGYSSLLPILVNWENGRKNTYSESDLEVVTEKQSEEKKVIGYRAPYDIFNGEVKKGMIFTKKYQHLPDTYYPENYQGSGPNHLPKEVVTSWEAVYEEEFKVGDYVVFTGEYAPGMTVVWDKSRIGKVYRVKKLESKGLKVSGGGNFFENFRKATSKEIEQHQNVEIEGYKAELQLDGNIYFGCVVLTKERLKAYKYLLSSSARASIVIRDTTITEEIIDHLLDKLEP